MSMATPEAVLLRDLGLGKGQIAYHGTFTVRDEDEIGRGSDAAVYRVVWQGIPVAAKVLHPNLVQTGLEGRDKRLWRFGAEIARLSQLHHPHLCQIIGVAVTEDRRLPVLVVELLDRTLYECSVGPDRLDNVTLLSFLADAMAGVRYLHSRDPPVIHRDLTLRNVLIKDQIAKLCDFGCARLRATNPADLVGLLPDLTACPGNALYMPPEALQNPPVYDESLDIFSFGVLATSVLTGVEPSTDLHTSPRHIRQIVQRADGTSEETVTPISEVERRRVDLGRIPAGHPLKPAIVRCLAVIADDRPRAEDLHEIVLDTVKLARDLSLSQPITAGTRVTRQLESISQQLSQQATCIADITARSSAVEDQLSTITQRLVDTQLETTAIRDQLQTTNQQVTEIHDRLQTASEQVTEIHDRLQTTSEQVTDIHDRLQTTSEQVTEIHDRLQTASEQVTEVHDGVETMSMKPRVTTIRDRQETTLEGLETRL